MRRFTFGCLSILMVSAPSLAQCGQWTPAGGFPGVVGPDPSRGATSVSALGTIDPDGAGPAPLELVVAGVFLYAGAHQATSLVRFAPSTGAWTHFGIYTGTTGIGPFAMFDGGELVLLPGLAQWNGSTFAPIASALDGPAHAAVRLGNGDVIAGGAFTTAGGVPAANIARWDGSTWHPLGSGVDGTVRALLRLPGDLVIVAGGFTTAGGTAANRIALWDGAAWWTFGSGFDGEVAHLALHHTGLIAAGSFTSAGGIAAQRIACWNGAAWLPLGTGIAGTVHGLAQLANGDLAVGGSFLQAGGVAVNHVAAWNGATWSPLGAGRPAPAPALLSLPGGDLFAVGTTSFLPADDGAATEQLARWDGSAWRAIGPGLDAPVRAAAIAASGDTILGGDFTQAGDVAASRIARWSPGGVWSPLGGGVDGTVRALAALPNGDVLAGGDFATAGGAPANRVARWDGAAWSAFGSGVDQTVRALAPMPGGGFVAGGDFTTAGGVPASRIAHFDGAVWLPLGSGTNDTVRALAVLADGDLIAAGDFTLAGGNAAARIARWDGSGWSPLGAGTNGPVHALAVLPNGDLVAGGTFTSAGGAPALHLARWNGASWSAMPVSAWEVPPAGQLGTGVTALAVLADGDLVATNYTFGFFFPGQPGSRIARWNGAEWGLMSMPLGRVYALAADASGQLAIGGTFSAMTDGTVGFPDDATAFAARFATVCPPVAAPFGIGCAGQTLTAATLPWVDTTFRANGSGLPDPALVVATSSFVSIGQGVLPLASVLAEGMPGCDVLVQPDILQLLIATGGSVQSSLSLPNVPPLVGLPFFHQMIPFELGPGGSIAAITATNALQLVAGDL